MLKLVKVDPRKIKIPELRVRARFDDESYRQFRASLAQIGQLQPPLVYEVNGELVLCDGEHRVEEAIGQAKTSIDVVVLPGDMVDVLTKNILVDHTRGKTPVTDMIRLIGTLIQDYGLDSEKISEKTGLTRDYVEGLIKLSKATPAVLHALDEEWIGVGAAREISRLPTEVQQEEMVAKQRAFKFKVPELRQFVDEVLSYMEEARAQPPAPVQSDTTRPRILECEGCHRPTEPRYLRPVVVCPDCFGEIWRLGKAREMKEEEIENEGVSP